FYIFYLSFTNKIKPTSKEVSMGEKILKPLFLVQIIFAGYMCCTSIFYFLDLLGYVYTNRNLLVYPSQYDLNNAAECQRLYCLGHAAFVHGMLVAYRSDIQSKYQTVVKNWPAFFLKVVIICLPLSFIFKGINGLSVLGYCMEGLAFVAATLAFAISIPSKKYVLIIISGVLYAIELFQTLFSGFKEPVIVSILILGIFLYPFYKRLILFTFLPILIFLFAVLPTYVNSFRAQIHDENKLDPEIAKAMAMERVKEDMSGENMAETNWEFLTNRISEINLFIRYKESINSGKGYYNFKILEQSLEALIPRLFWKTKPITEEVSMQRVIENGAVDDNSIVSAKPQYIVDGYLSGGAIGVWLALFFYGWIAQFICNKAESWFGGYFLGTGFAFTGLFQHLWRGNCFEFIFNDIVWSFIVMYLLFIILKVSNILVRKVNQPEPLYS
ncbi:MAG TPA: hypothetical protein VFQ58_09555, partial [Flavisolibacter sp.]|nr:hypothetical protein [Flavisolibacter sp.]